MKKKLLAAGLIAGLTLSSAAVYAAEDEGGREIERLDYTSLLHYELEPAGTLEDPDGSFYFGYDTFMQRNGDAIDLLSASGDVLLSDLDDIDYLGGGLISARTPLEEDNVNTTGLYTTDGSTLVANEAASIVMPCNREDGSARFVGLIYTTEETDNEDECIIYFTSDMISLSVGEEDIMYKGYMRIYDVERQQFVPGLEFSSVPRDALHDLGSSFVIQHDGAATMYDPDGNSLWESEAYLADSSYNAVTVSNDGTYYIVDSTGSDTFQSDYSISVVSAAMDYFSVYDGESDAPYHVIDINGSRVSETALPIVYDASANIIRTQDADGNYIAVDFDGTVVDDDVDLTSFVCGGYGYISHENSDLYSVITPEAVISDLEEGSTYQLYFGKDNYPVALNTGEVFGTELDTENTDADLLAPALASFRLTSSSGTKYCVYDVFTGEELLPPEYDEINIAGNYLYAGKSDSSGSDTWEVYRIRLLPAEG